MEKRKPRFRREEISYQPTERDLEIVRHVARHRFLATPHFRQLVKGGGQGIGRRLHTLYHAGVLDRPRAQIEYFHRGGGSRPLVYGLGRQGARMLYQYHEGSRVDWTAKNRTATKLFIEHTLRVADFMVALETACAESGIELTRPGESTTGRLRWSVFLSQGDDYAQLGVIPDATFALNEPGAAPIHFCLEVDRATMPINRRHLHQTSACRKFLAYHATWRQRVLNRLFDWKRFQVLTLTTSIQRENNLREAARSLPFGHGLFLFSRFDLIEASDNILKLMWSGVFDNHSEILSSADRSTAPI
jgi:hypothetical protein